MDYNENDPENTAVRVIMQMIADGEISQEVAEKYFPELKESEDERIRKFLIQMAQNGHGGDKDWWNKCVAWLEKRGQTFTKKDIDDAYLKGVCDAKRELEKQDDQKPVDKVEPKFKAGDWVACNGLNTALVVNIDDNKYEVECIDGIKGFPHIDYVDRHFHRWTIQDAKDGDVLHSTGFHNDCIFIFNRLDNWKFDEPNGDRAVVTGYCCLSISADKMEFGIQGPDCIEVDTVKPATKIQHDLLFQKMKEAGYKWDAEKKGLKKISQEYPLTPDECIKSSWSEKDEKYLKLAIENFQTLGNSFLTSWLKDLKDRVQPQSKQEWSVEDEAFYQRLEQIVCKVDIETFQGDRNLHSWLKFLRPQSQWKPSDEQMDALHYVTNFDYGGHKATLVSLYEQLKKLKG